MAAPVRFAVVGLGDITQRAVLPAFEHAKKKAALTALVSGEPKKRRVLGRRLNGVVACGDRTFRSTREGRESTATKEVMLGRKISDWRTSGVC